MAQEQEKGILGRASDMLPDLGGVGDFLGGAARRVGGAVQGGLIGLGSGMSGKDFLTPWLQQKAERRKFSKTKSAQERVVRGMRAANPDLFDEWGRGLMTEGEPLDPEALIQVIADMPTGEFNAARGEYSGFLSDRMKKAETEEERERVAAVVLAGLNEQFVGEGLPMPERGENEDGPTYASRAENALSAYRAGVQRQIGESATIASDIDALSESLDDVDPSLIVDDSATSSILASLGELTERAADLSPEYQTTIDRARRGLLSKLESRRQQARDAVLAQRMKDGEFLNDVVNPLAGDVQGNRFRPEDYGRAGFSDHLRPAASAYGALRAAAAAGIHLDGRLGELQGELAKYAERPTLGGADWTFEETRGVVQQLHGISPDVVNAQVEAKKIGQSRKMVNDLFSMTFDDEALAGVSQEWREAFVRDERNFLIENGHYRGLNAFGVKRLVDAVPDSALGSVGEAAALAERMSRALPVGDQKQIDALSAGLRRRAAEKIVQSGTDAPKTLAALSEVADREIAPDFILERIQPTDGAFAATDLEEFWKAVGPHVYPDKFSKTTSVFNRMAGEVYETTSPISPKVPSGDKDLRAFLARVTAMADAGYDFTKAPPAGFRGARAGEAKIRAWIDQARQAPNEIALTKSLRDVSEIRKDIKSRVFGEADDASVDQLRTELVGQAHELESARGSGVNETFIAQGLARIEGQIADLEEAKSYGVETRAAVASQILAMAFFDKWGSEEDATEMIADLAGHDDMSLGKRIAGERALVEELAEAETPIHRFAILRAFVSRNPRLFADSTALPGGREGSMMTSLLGADLERAAEYAGKMGDKGVDTEALRRLGWAPEGEEMDPTSLALWAIWSGIRPSVR